MISLGKPSPLMTAIARCNRGSKMSPWSLSKEPANGKLWRKRKLKCRRDDLVDFDGSMVDMVDIAWISSLRCESLGARGHLDAVQVLLRSLANGSYGALKEDLTVSHQGLQE